MIEMLESRQFCSVSPLSAPAGTSALLPAVQTAPLSRTASPTTNPLTPQQPQLVVISIIGVLIGL